MQAVCCGLHNISSTGEGGQWSLPDDGEKYFGKEKYTVTFVECREEASSKTWFVNLADENNQDIADLLVADGLAVKNTVLKSKLRFISFEFCVISMFVRVMRIVFFITRIVVPTIKKPREKKTNVGTV